jgi:hypothetical protein|tara:strand:- start:83 stop:1183 length:1101 start_codon:yes stop_codon:yes gene_type:complete
VDHSSARDGALVSALKDYAQVLMDEALVLRSVHHFEKHVRFVTVWYTQVWNVVISSKFVANRRNELKKSHFGKQQLSDSFHVGDVMQALLHYEVQTLPGAIADALSPEKAKEVECLFYRRFFAWCTRVDNLARSSDSLGLKIDGSFFPTSKRGSALPVDDCANAVIGSVRMWDTKTAKQRWSIPHNVNAPRQQFVTDAKRSSYWRCLTMYLHVSSPYRANMIQSEANTVLIATKICNRKQTQRFDQTQGKKVTYTPPCGGKCGHIHPLSPDTVANDIKWCLGLVDAGDQYKAHATRGCAEMCYIEGGKLSTQFDPDEARRRARHSEQTQKEYYVRAVNPRWLTTIRGKRKIHLQNMYPEEYVRQWT